MIGSAWRLSVQVLREGLVGSQTRTVMVRATHEHADTWTHTHTHTHCVLLPVRLHAVEQVLCADRALVSCCRWCVLAACRLAGWRQVATLSPAHRHAEHTLNTLRYAARLKAVPSSKARR